MSILGDPLDPFATPAPQPPEKKVTFAPFFQVSRDIPWSHNSAAAPDLRAFSGQERLPLQSSLKTESICSLRTEIRTGENLAAYGILLVVVCLLALFFLIWYIVHVVLLLEVESEIGNRATRSAGKFG
jgi:hypothetical protein